MIAIANLPPRERMERWVREQRGDLRDKYHTEEVKFEEALQQLSQLGQRLDDEARRLRSAREVLTEEGDKP